PSRGSPCGGAPADREVCSRIVQVGEWLARLAVHERRLLSPHRARRLGQPDQERLAERPLHRRSRPRFASPPYTIPSRALLRTRWALTPVRHSCPRPRPDATRTPAHTVSL